MSGTLYIIGTGPGDPQLLTLKAVKVVENCPVIIAPHGSKSGGSTALAIVEAVVPVTEKAVIQIHFPMKKIRNGHEPAPEILAAWRHAAEHTLRYLDQGLDVSVGKSFFKANGRSVSHNETIGEIRAVRDNSTNKIIGVTMVGSVVTEMIGAARALIGSAEKITEISFPHPTVSEVLKEAVEDAFGLSLHNPPKA